MFSVTIYLQQLSTLPVEYPKGLSWVHYCFYYISMSSTFPISYLFIYDTNIFFEASNLDTLQTTGNREMCKLVNWLNSNIVIFSANNIIINKPLKPVTIIINRKAIEQKDYVKYLGIPIDSKLSFKQHIIAITNTISRAICLLYKLRHHGSKRILMMMYYILAYPFLIYDYIHLNKIHLLQKKVVRLVTQYPTVYPYSKNTILTNFMIFSYTPRMYGIQPPLVITIYSYPKPELLSL